jgi:hypothetical protein
MLAGDASLGRFQLASARARPCDGPTDTAMTPADVERVFGRSRLQIPTGHHVEVFREVARSGEERRYTKRFLQTDSVDFRPWTEREYRVLVRLGRLQGAPVAKALDLLPPDENGTPRLQTRDAGATLDQWATRVPLRRGETTLRNVFDDCANWWALARQCMVALDALHALGFVHLDTGALPPPYLTTLVKSSSRTKSTSRRSSSGACRRSNAAAVKATIALKASMRRGNAARSLTSPPRARPTRR